VSATVAVLGPGAVGGALAVRLTRAGRQVVCVARQATAEAIRSEGLTLDAPDGSFTERMEAVERLEQPVDLLLVTVKAPDLAAALERIDGRAGLAVPLLNGLEHMERIRARLGSRVAAGSIGRFEGRREGRTRVVQTSGTALLTGPAEAAGILSVPGIEVRVGEGERRVLWEKLARLAPLAALTALRRRPLGELRADPDLRIGVEEACAVASADGAAISASEEWAVIESLPATLTTSAARDVAAGRPSELDALVGAVVRAGRRLGVPTPTLDRLEAECRAL
jgi:2-dehydropantoate 2-reductase